MFLKWQRRLILKTPSRDGRSCWCACCSVCVRVGVWVFVWVLVCECVWMCVKLSVNFAVVAPERWYAPRPQTQSKCSVFFFLSVTFSEETTSANRWSADISWHLTEKKSNNPAESSGPANPYRELKITIPVERSGKATSTRLTFSFPPPFVFQLIFWVRSASIRETVSNKWWYRYDVDRPSNKKIIQLLSSNIIIFLQLAHDLPLSLSFSLSNSSFLS